MNRIHIATALVRRGDRVLLVASRYPNHEQPLWNLPGGRQLGGELLSQTAVRELFEETSLHGKVRELCFVSESYDGQTHFTNFTFSVEAAGDVTVPDESADHITAAAFTPIRSIAQRIAVAVVREPLLAYLNGTLPRYAGYTEAGVSIVFPD